MIQNTQDKNIIYLYDLPKDELTSIKIAEAFKEKAGVQLDPKPQIKKDPTRPFYSAMVVIKDQKEWKEASEKMRYFKIGDKPCRALPFDRTLLGSNKEKLFDQSVFVKLPKNFQILHEDLEKLFSDCGQVKSLKVSLNENYSSRNYGYICFQDKEAALKALSFQKEGFSVTPLLPKTARQMRNIINNVYVKNIPTGWTSDQVHDLFSPFGNIKSLFLQQHENIGQFGFVCYEDVEGINKEYGPECAEKAIQELNDRDFGTGLRLVVKYALNKTDRVAEKLRETIRYKASKRRCNLYVKNFPNSYTKQDIVDLFKLYGEIENVRVEQKNGNSFAFVCYKEPNEAANAKQTLHNYQIEGKMLMINYYEIKEFRQIQMEAARDKADWDKYTAQQSGGFKWNDIVKQPHLGQLLQQLLQFIDQNAQVNKQMRHFDHMIQNHRRSRTVNSGPRNGSNNQQNSAYAQQQMQGSRSTNMMMQQNRQLNPQQIVAMPPLPPAPIIGMPPTPIIGMPSQPTMIQPNQAANIIAQQFENQARRIYSAIQENNKHYKDQVGEIIYNYIEKMVGPERAPKITGMLIELPVYQIQIFMQSYQNLVMKVYEAVEHLNKSMSGTQQ